MRISDLPARNKSVLELAPVDLTAFEKARPGKDSWIRLIYNDTVDSYLLKSSAGVFPVDGCDDRAQLQLRALLDRGLPRLTGISVIKEDAPDRVSLALQVNEYATEFSLADQLDLGVDDVLVDAVRQRRKERLATGAIIALLEREFLIQNDAEEHCVAVTLAPRQDELGTAFRIIGSRHACDVRQEDGRFLVTRFIENAVHRSKDQPLGLIRGRIGFTDATAAGRYRGEAQHLLQKALREQSSYLGFWQRYDDLERKTIEERAQRIGRIAYVDRHPLPDGAWHFDLYPEDDLGDTLQALQDEGDVHLEADSTPQGPALDRRDRERRFIGKLMASSFVQGFIVLRPDDESLDDDPIDPPIEGYLHPSLLGDRIRLQRRQQAMTRILGNESPMPQLALILEGGALQGKGRKRAHETMTSSARAVFDGEPTARQVQALEIALNTPDIALIQGPPGTGKTKVITALQVHLAEIARKGVAGNTLLSSYQHDAVENAASRSTVFGLPALKVGQRRGQEEQDVFGAWVRERIHRLEGRLAQFPEAPVTRALREVKLRLSTFVRDGSSPMAALEAIGTIGGNHLSGKSRDRIFTLKQQLAKGRRSDEAGDDRAFAGVAVRGLRTDPVSFGDDGPQSAYRVLRRLPASPLLDGDARTLLERAADWSSAEAPTFLSDLEELKQRLLDNLQPDERPRNVARAHADVVDLFADVINELDLAARTEPGNVATVLDLHLQDLKGDPTAARQAVAKYTSVLAATCQQAASRHMSEFKSHDSVFENVIIDEAARANPLDLLIPMSLAETRIVLVGDHRQLPHMLEPEVERRLEGDLDQALDEALHQSLFERLFVLAKQLEEKDGRPRTVTLDQQYRMHPVLGQFVSDTFYERHDPNERFGSPLSAPIFAHGLDSYGDAVAAWIDVPLSKGREEGRRSKARRVEAETIAVEVKRLLTERPDLSIGVISFYSAQVDELWKQLVRLELAERTESSYRVTPAWSTTLSTDGLLPQERLRVGTVDAFQGKEFDVVFLSMTRSNDLPSGDVRDRRRKWGHLMLENRLCVAMSRQKRLLITVGDARMLAPEDARASIPGLVAFRELCEGAHGALVS